jgi:hypothetical protein
LLAKEIYIEDTDILVIKAKRKSLAFTKPVWLETITGAWNEALDTYLEINGFKTY